MKIKTILCALLLLCMAQPLLAKPKKSSKSKTIRVMDFNIADGMWKDQFNNYDEFVKWMNEQNVDIFAVCEAATHWDKDKKNLPKTDEARYLPAHWGELAARWGHNYTAVGTYGSNYPVAFTSRYPIDVVQRLGGKKLSRGALHVKILGVNYVVLHLWPQAHRRGDKTKKGGGGDAFRLAEINYILDKTIRNPEFADEKHWVMMGDFNSRSPKDSDFHVEMFGEARAKKINYIVHNEVLKHLPCDVVFDKNPNEFQSSVRKGRARIDYIYCTEQVYSAVKRAYTHVDDFVTKVSDHRPLVMELKMPIKGKNKSKKR